MIAESAAKHKCVVYAVARLYMKMLKLFSCTCINLCAIARGTTSRKAVTARVAGFALRLAPCECADNLSLSSPNAHSRCYRPVAVVVTLAAARSNAARAAPAGTLRGLRLGDYPCKNQSSVLDFSDKQWDCTTVDCTQHVPAGTMQPDYECAEFVARSLAAGGCIPLSPTAPQSDYASHDGFDLLEVTSLSAYLQKNGWTNVGTDPNSVRLGYAVFGGYSGPMQHAVVGVSDGTVSAHNAAQYHVPAANEFYGGQIDQILAYPK
jgi:hypothetical protein